MEHPITPPPELVDNWLAHAPNPLDRLQHVATNAARWGADQELEACRKAIISQIITIDNIGLSGPAAVLHTETCSSWPAFAHMVSRQLRAARRPNPPSLKEQASKSLDQVVECLKMLVPGASVDGVHIETIRRALESLPDPQD